ncbi:MAG TPA: hypothetical protein VII32_14640 [Thermoanaerobaculia bacterium]
MMLNAVDILERAISFSLDHWVFWLVVVIAIVFWSAAASRRFQSGAKAPHSRVACAIVVGVSLAASICFAWLHGMPIPQYHDDFAYVLDADTFAHGRMSNPTHPMWPHFETMHVLHVPRYISKYPIGEGLTFAAGSLLFGHPLRAVWILGAAACAAIWWALRVWTTPALALLGGIATAVHPTMVEWMESYHGGALAALGGALLLAAGKDRKLNAIAAIGVVLLAISRPYEGMVFCLAIGIVLIRRVTVAGAIIVLAGLAFICFNNRSITGNPLVLPYSVYERQYDPAPNFLWEKARPMPNYRNAEMAFIYRVVYLGQYKRVHAPGGLLDETLKKIDVIDRAVFGPPKIRNPRPLFLLLLIAAIPLLREDRNARLIAIILLLFAFAPFSIIWWMQLHYLAPASALAACLVMLLLRRLFVATPILGVAILILFFANAGLTWMQTPDYGFAARRQQIARSVLAQGGRHLVIVAPNVFDAVYNGADLDHAPIVWARDLGADANAKLRAYYRDRTVWLLATDGSSGRLRLRQLP